MNGMGIINRAIHPNTVLANLNVNALYICVVKRGKMVPPRLPVKDVVTERYWVLRNYLRERLCPAIADEANGP